MSNLICIISPHEKRFWQADIYRNGWSEDESPNGFCTGKVGGTKEELIEKVKNITLLQNSSKDLLGSVLSVVKSSTNLNKSAMNAVALLLPYSIAEFKPSGYKEKLYGRFSYSYKKSNSSE